jgi:hypothetical protein
MYSRFLVVSIQIIPNTALAGALATLTLPCSGRVFIEAKLLALLLLALVAVPCGNWDSSPHPETSKNTDTAINARQLTAREYHSLRNILLPSLKLN